MFHSGVCPVFFLRYSEIPCFYSNHKIEAGESDIKEKLFVWFLLWQRIRIFVNATVKDGSDVSELMDLFTQDDNNNILTAMEELQQSGRKIDSETVLQFLMDKTEGKYLT